MCVRVCVDVDDRETFKEFRYELKKLAEKFLEVLDENLGLSKGHIKKAFDGEEGENTSLVQR